MADEEFRGLLGFLGWRRDLLADMSEEDWEELRKIGRELLEWEQKTFGRHLRGVDWAIVAAQSLMARVGNFDSIEGGVPDLLLP